MQDLQELSELGVPLYSNVGPHGGYRVLKEKEIPLVTLTEEEATTLFFAVYALCYHVGLEFSSALNKFYNLVPENVRSLCWEMSKPSKLQENED